MITALGKFSKPVPIVIYHKNCIDGFTAAFACWLLHPDWEFYPATHGDPPPNVEGRDVYILDFCYPRAVLEWMLEIADDIVILDHHQSAEKDLEGLEYPNLTLIFDMNHAGCVLAWGFFQGSETPELFKYVEDRDLWRFKLPNTREICAAIFSHSYDFDLWVLLHEICRQHHTRHQLVIEGTAINRKLAKEVTEFLKDNVQRADIGGYNVPVANLPYTHASDAGHVMAVTAPFAATYYDGPDGRTYSLRSSATGMDVSEIASLYGGGGHKHAAGFRLAHGVSL